MVSIVSQIVVILVNRELSDGSVNWPRVRRRSLPQYPVMFLVYFRRDKTSIINRVRQFPYLDQTTNTAAAIQYMRETMFTPYNGDRSSSPNAVIIITDGVPRVPDNYYQAVQNTVNQANLARQRGINIFAVGIGE